MGLSSRCWLLFPTGSNEGREERKTANSALPKFKPVALFLFVCYYSSPTKTPRHSSTTCD